MGLIKYFPKSYSIGFVIAILFSIFQLYTSLFGIFKMGIVHRAIHFGFVLILFFLITNRSKGKYTRVIDWIVIFFGLPAVGYVVFGYENILALLGPSSMTGWDIYSSVSIILIILIAIWRVSKIFFFLIIGCVVYALFGQFLPGILNHSGIPILRFSYLISFTGEGIFGLPLEVSSTYLFLFIFFGVVLEKTGTGAFFINGATALVGRFRGGPAKTALLSSAGLGSIVGSSIANVVTTGAFTIPLMKKMGFPRHVAAAVETVSSEGGQILPPVMGAGAFIMVALTGIPYNNIVLAALIPAILYFVSVWYVIDFESRKMGLLGLPKSKLPRFKDVVKDKGHLFFSLIVLIYCLLILGMTPDKAGVIAILVAIGLAMVRKNTRLSIKDFIDILKVGGENAVEIAMLCASIGIIVGVITTTGLALRFSELILSLTDGSMLLTLFFAMVACVILGMGMPTPVAYMLMALFTAPALIESGVPELAAHLFLFYFAVKSGSTPPVAIVATVAAGLAEANWLKTGWTAFKYSLPGFVVAFMFVYSPALLFEGAWFDILLGFITALIGVVGFTGALQKMWGQSLNWIESIILGLFSIMLIGPGLIKNLIAIVALILLWIYKANRKNNFAFTGKQNMKG